MQKYTLDHIGLISIPRKLLLPMAAVRYPYFLQEGWHRAPWRGGTGGGLPKCTLGEHELVRRTSRATQGLLWYWVCGCPSHSPLPLLLFPLRTFSFIGLYVLGPRGPRILAVFLPQSYKSWGYWLVPHTRLYVPCFKDTDNIWCPEGATAS